MYMSNVVITPCLDDAFKPYFEQISHIESSVDELANIVKYLDQYSKNLEIQLKPYL